MARMQRGFVVAASILVGSALFAACGGASGVSALHLRTDATSAPTPATPAVSSSAGSMSCSPSGTVKTYQLASISDIRVAVKANPSEATAALAVNQVIQPYMANAWPSGNESGIASAGAIAQWTGQLVGGDPLMTTFADGPVSIGSWSGGQPNAAQAAGVAYDARFLFYQGNSSGTSAWGSADLVGERSAYGVPTNGASVSYGPSGNITGICTTWWTEVGRQSGSSFTWWYIHGVALFEQPSGTTSWQLVDPVISGFIYDETGSPSSEPNWIPSFGPPAPEPAGATPVSVGT